MAQVYDSQVRLQDRRSTHTGWFLVAVILFQTCMVGSFALYPYGGYGELCGRVHSVAVPSTHGFHGVLLNTTSREPEAFQSNPEVAQDAAALESQYVCFDARPLFPWEQTRYALDNISLR